MTIVQWTVAVLLAVSLSFLVTAFALIMKYRGKKVCTFYEMEESLIGRLTIIISAVMYIISLMYIYVHVVCKTT